MRNRRIADGQKLIKLWLGGGKPSSHLEVLETDVALNPAGVLGLFHLDLAGVFVVAERAVEERVQRNDVLLLRTGGTLRLATTHRKRAQGSRIGGGGR